MDLDIDEATLLKAYSLDSLEPTSYKIVDVEDAAAATGLTSADEPDPLGLQDRIQTRQLPKEVRAQVSVSSKTFDPKVFLSTIHPEATFADLSYGLNQLRDNIEQRSQALKVLVEDNFDRFVAVKATTDGVYREMKEADGGPLRPDSDYGVKELRDILAQASARADQVFTPVLENNLKAMKLRSTLGVFERSKFFFNLPGSLAESIEAGRYDAALRDYEKGKYLLENRPGQLLAFNTTAGQAGDPRASGTEKQRQQQQRVFKKVWDAVEETMKGMERKLLALLHEPKRSVNEQEKTIEMLLELSPREDPVAVFLKSQHAHIHSLMKASTSTYTTKINSSRAANDIIPRTEKDRAKDIQSCLRQITRGEPSFERNYGAATCRAVLQLVRNVSANIAQTLPSYWRVCKDHSDGKFPKSKSPEIQGKAISWAAESIETYIRNISSFFRLTDVAILARKPLSPLPDWLPASISSMTAAHYMHLILTEITETVNALIALEVAKMTPPLQALLRNTRFAFTEVLCNLWQNDAKIFHMLEDWTINPDEQSTTLYLKELAAFHRSNARAAFHIASGQDRNPYETSQKARDTGVPLDSTARIKSAWLDSIYAFLDGIVHLAFSEYDPLDPTITTSQKVVGNSRLTVDVQELDTRILLSVTNLSHLNRMAIPVMAKQFQEVYHCKMSEDLATIDEVAGQLDDILFQDFVKRRSDAVSSVFRNGILHTGITWSSLPKPTEVNPFIYEALLGLVQVHSQVQSVAKPLVSRTITTLLESLTDVILASFSQVPVFNLGGMLQATLEIEFVHQTLSAFVSPRAEENLKAIYEVVSSRYQKDRRSTSSAEEEAAMLERELNEVKKTLVASRRMTALEFLCFRKGSSSSSSSGGGGSGSSTRSRSIVSNSGGSISGPASASHSQSRSMSMVSSMSMTRTESRSSAV